MLRKASAFLFIFISAFAFAQSRVSIWYFGDNAGLDFNSGSPVALTNGQTSTWEGCATICDCNGALLFYTDGVKVWNKNHTVMPNGSGLFGNTSSTQSGVIVPKPGSTTEYYIFTADAFGGGNGICYSLVDMTLAGGLGNVTTKNVPLLSPAAEKVTATYQSNGLDYWVVAHTSNTDEFYAYSVTSGGVNTSAVVSNAGTTFAGTGGIFGYLHFSPDGSKLASILQSGNLCDILDFNTSSGTVTTNFSIPTSNVSIYNPYGVEFSPDASRLYVGIEVAKQIYQYDMSLGSSAAIISSATLIGTTAAGECGALQIGPDGRIYVAVFAGTALAVINNPNSLGAGCNYVDNAIGLSGKISRLGLPNYIPAFVAPPAAITLFSSSDPICNGAKNGAAVISVTGGSGNFSYSWSDGGTGVTNSNLGGGTYTVTVTGAGTVSCTGTTTSSNTITVTLNDPPKITLTTNSTPASCGQSNGSVTVASVNNGNPPYTYLWSNSGTNSTESGLNKGMYHVTITDSKGCTAVDSVDVFEPAALSTTSGKANAACGGNNGTAGVTVSGGVPTYNYLWSNGATAATLNNLGANNYTVTVTDAWGCTKTDSFVIIQTGALTLSSKDQIACWVNGNTSLCNASSAITATTGTGPYSYSWTNGQTGQTGVNLCSATYYTVTVTDSKACSATTVVLPAASSIYLSTTKSDITCNGLTNGSATAVPLAASPYNYIWSTGATAATISNLGVNTYTVTLTDVNNCTITKTASITQPTSITANGTSTPSNCTASNGSVSINASGGTPSYSYSWSSGPSAQTVNGLASGTYSVTVKDANNCTFSTTAIVGSTGGAVFAAPTLSNLLCNGDKSGSVTMTASGGATPYSYLWSNGSTAPTISKVAAGTYTVSLTDGNNCQSITTVTLTQPPAIIPVVSSSPQNCSTANGSASVSVSGGQPGYSYTWSAGASSATATGLTAGNYTVTIKDAGSCTISTTAIVGNIGGAVFSAPLLSNVLCNGAKNGSAAISASGGATPYTYLWSTGSTTTAISKAGAGVYTVTITDGNGCQTLTTITITEPPPISSVVSSNPENCGAANGTATVSASGGKPGYTYAWSGGSAQSTATGLTAGNYTVTVKDASGCSVQSTVTVGSNGGATLSTPAVTDVSCFGAANGSAVAGASGGATPYTYGWTGGAIGATVNNLIPGIYTVTLTDGNSCTSTATITISEPTVIQPTTGTTPTGCGVSTGTATANASGGKSGYSYSWSNGPSSQTISGLAATAYTVTVTDASGCTISTSALVGSIGGAVFSSPIISNVDCNGNLSGTASVSASAGSTPYTFTWSDGTAGATVTGVAAGTYTVTVIDANSCPTLSTVTITEPALLVPSVTSTPANCAGLNGSGSVSAIGGTANYTYTWSNGAVGASTKILSPGVYSVTTTDAKGCTKISTVNVTQQAPFTLGITEQGTVCGKINGSASVSVTGGNSLYTYNWSNGTGAVTSSNQSTISSVGSGIYTVTIIDAGGCILTTTATVTDISPGVVSVTALQQSIVQGSSVSITASGGGVSYTWVPSASLSCSVCQNPVAAPLVTTTYTVVSKDVNGCSISAMVTISVKSPCTGDEKDVFIANVFSPNGDGLNDVLFVEGNGLVNIYWAIYDRWGNLLFETFNQNDGWNGTRNGKAMDSGTYVYYLKATCLQTNTEVKLKGNVSLIK